MATLIRPDLKADIVKYGAGCVDDCFNCGNCTAVCPLSQDTTAFPRKMVRYIQIGLKDKLTCASEPWLCYSCGECAATCPRDATPVNTMAALRRYATAQYDVTGLARLMYKLPWFALLVTVALGLFLGLFHLSAQVAGHGAEPAHWAAFSWIPYGTIHQIGLVVGGVMMLMIAAGVVNAARLMLKPRGGFGWLRKHKPAAWLATMVETGRELATMRRHHECGSEDGGAPEPRLLSARFAHLTIMWGFLMLLAATTLDFLFVFLLHMEFYLIARPLGIIGGLVMLYGLLVFTWKRAKGATPSTKTTTFADGWLLFFLIVLDVTGFLLLAIVSLGIKGMFSDILLLVHSVMAMEMVLLFTLTKLGHALFRPMALFFHLLERRPQAA
jgi:ferredoxin